MPFLGQEGHVLDCWRASSSTEKGVSLKREECDCWNILTVSIYLISVYSLTEDSSFSHEGHFFFSQRTFLFLTELHRRTEHTSFHRDIKSTDITERYSHRSLTPSPSPNGEGSSMWGYPFWPATDRKWAAKHLEDMEGYLGDHSPLQSERGWGWGFCWL